MKVDLVTRFYYEDLYIEHFINYYLALGFDHIYILWQNDQNMPPNFDNKFVTIIEHNYKGDDVIKKIPELIVASSEYTFICDSDEYLYLKNYKNIQEFLKTIPNDADQIFFHWANVVNFSLFEKKVDLFEILESNKLYADLRIKSIIKTEKLYCKNIVIGSHCMYNVKSYLWNNWVESKPIHKTDAKSYYTSDYPFIVHFISRSMQNNFIKCFSTYFLPKKIYDIDNFKDIVREKKIYEIKKIYKFALFFGHLNFIELPSINLNFKKILINFEEENKLLESICEKNNIDYLDLVEYMKKIDDEFSHLFQK